MIDHERIEQVISLISRFIVSQEQLAVSINEQRATHLRMAMAQEKSSAAIVQREELELEKWEYEKSRREAWEANNAVVSETNRLNLEAVRLSLAAARLRNAEAELSLQMLKLRAERTGG